MPDLFRVGRNAMATQQDRHGHEPGFVAALRFGARNLGFGSGRLDGHIALFAEARTHQCIAGTHHGVAGAHQGFAGTSRPAHARGTAHVSKGMKHPIGDVLRSSEDQTAVPDLLEFRARHQLRTRRGRMQHERPVVVDLAEKQKSAIMQRCDPGQLDARKSRPMRCSRTDLDPELARATKQCADTYCAASAAIAELVGLGVDAMKAQEQSQGSKPWSAAWAFPFWIAIF